MNCSLFGGFIMWTTFLEIVLLILYFPLTLLYLFCGLLTENPDVTTISQWFEFRFMGYVGPFLGLLTFPCLVAAIQLRKKGKKKLAAWLRVAPLLVFASFFVIAYLLRWLFG